MDIKQLNEYIPESNIIANHDYVWNKTNKIITLSINGKSMIIGKAKKFANAEKKTVKWAKKVKKWDDKYNQVKKPFLMKKWKWELKKEQISKETLRDALTETVESKKETEQVTSYLKNEIKDTQQEQQTNLNVEKTPVKKAELSEIETLKNELLKEKKNLAEANKKLDLLLKEVADLKKENNKLKKQIKSLDEQKVTKSTLIA